MSNATPKGYSVYKREVYRHPAYHCAMPSLIRTADGRMLCAFRRAPDRRLLGFSSVTHVDANAQVLLSVSEDGGANWNPPKLMFAHPDAGCQDPCLALSPDGSLLCTGYGWTAVGADRARKAGIHADGYGMTGGWLIYSNDQGRTWYGLQSAPRLHGTLISDPWGKPLPCFNRGALALYENQLYWSVTRQASAENMRGTIHLLSSSDGKDWEQRNSIADIPDYSLNESSLLITREGEMLCFIRTIHPDDKPWVARSGDGGKRFKLLQLPWRGSPLQATLLPGGEILLVYGFRHGEKKGIRYRLLRPDARNIETAREYVLDDKGGSWDVGYPWVCCNTEGMPVVVWYTNREDAERFIVSARLEPSRA